MLQFLLFQQKWYIVRGSHEAVNYWMKRNSREVVLIEVNTGANIQGRRGKTTPSYYASSRNLAPVQWNFIKGMPSRALPEGKCLELTPQWIENSSVKCAYRFSFDRMFEWPDSVFTCDSVAKSDWLVGIFFDSFIFFRFAGRAGKWNGNIENK